MLLLDTCERWTPWIVLIALCASCDSSRRDAVPPDAVPPRVKPGAAASETRPPDAPGDPGDPDGADDLDDADGQGIPDAPRAPRDPAPADDPGPGAGSTPEESSTPVQITEIHYHAAASAAGSEFIEVVSTGPERVSLDGWRLTGGVKFVFPPGAALEPGAITVVARNAATLRPWPQSTPQTGRRFPLMGRLSRAARDCKRCGKGPSTWACAASRSKRLNCKLVAIMSTKSAEPSCVEPTAKS